MSSAILTSSSLAAQRRLWLREPLKCQEALWPHIYFYDKQVEIIESVRDNTETYVVAGNQLGKDFVAAFIILWYFICNDEVRIVPTSVSDRHLIVLWDEISTLLATSSVSLKTEDGGFLDVTHHRILKTVAATPAGIEKSYVLAQVSQHGESMAGHHAPHTLLVGDEASGIDDEVYKQAQGWGKKYLIFGNPNPCSNFFYRGVMAGDLEV